MARPKSWKTVPGASRLSVILAHLRQAPRLDLQQNLRSIKLTLAYRNDHWGARRFMKEDLPRIRYANPNIEILVDKKPKGPNDELPSELVLEFDDGRTEKFGVDNMWSTDILTRVLDTAGGAFWPNWKAARLQQGLPVLDRPEPRATKAPTLSNPFQQRTKDAVRGVPLDDAAETVVDMSKTGAARILP